MRGGNNWNVQGRTFRPSDEPRSNGARITLTNLAAARIDIDRAGLSTSSPITVEVTGDGETELRLAGSWPVEVVVVRDGVELGTVHAEDGVVVLDGDLSGTHTYVLRPG